MTWGRGAVAPQVGRFEVLSVLGTGGEAVVLLARDRADAVPGPIGLKVAKRLGDATAFDRLRDEARILASLSHGNILKVHRLLEKDGLPIVVMEYVEGASGMEQLGRLPDGLPAPVAAEMAWRTAMALEAAWAAHRIVHRDIKPANLLVSLDGVVKVVDFGIALAAEAAGEAEDCLGTPGYVAPERRYGRSDSPAVDSYALGASLFGLLCGRLLVPSPSPLGHDASIARGVSGLSPAGVGPSGRRALRALVIDLCRHDPAQRPFGSALVERVRSVLQQLGAPDLQAYAAQHVAPILAARARAHPRSHPLWPHLAFLERGGEVRELPLDSRGPVRALALREVAEPADLEATLGRLGRARWWRSVPDAPALECALAALRGTRDPRAIARALELTDHADPRVGEAAWEVLAAAC